MARPGWILQLGAIPHRIVSERVPAAVREQLTGQPVVVVVAGWNCDACNARTLPQRSRLDQNGDSLGWRPCSLIIQFHNSIPDSHRFLGRRQCVSVSLRCPVRAAGVFVPVDRVSGRDFEQRRPPLCRSCNVWGSPRMARCGGSNRSAACSARRSAGHRRRLISPPPTAAAGCEAFRQPGRPSAEFGILRRMLASPAD